MIQYREHWTRSQWPEPNWEGCLCNTIMLCIYIRVILILAFILSFKDIRREISVHPSIYDEGWCHWWRCTNFKKRLKKIGYLAWRRTYLYSDNYLQIFCRLFRLTYFIQKGAESKVFVSKASTEVSCRRPINI